MAHQVEHKSELMHGETRQSTLGPLIRVKAYNRQPSSGSENECVERGHPNMTEGSEDGLSDNISGGHRSPWRIATRINSFRRDGASVAEAICRVGQVPGVSALELNFPQHFRRAEGGERERAIAGTGLPITALNLRFEGPLFERGAFTSPVLETRRTAIELAAEAVDVAAGNGADHVVLWMADDGWDYPFQVRYDELWQREIDGFREVASRNPAIHVSVEYKPSDPRRFSLVRTMSDALLATSEVGLPNFGVTFDVCHAYMAGEHPPAAVAMALRQGRLFGVHMNDGYGTADDGLLIGSVHGRDTLELLHVLREGNYSGTIYFDTFPIREDPAAELASNIKELGRLISMLDTFRHEDLKMAQDAQDSLSAFRAIGPL